jgi:hypothetical protein
MRYSKREPKVDCLYHVGEECVCIRPARSAAEVAVRVKAKIAAEAWAAGGEVWREWLRKAREKRNDVR